MYHTGMLKVTEELKVKSEVEVQNKIHIFTCATNFLLACCI